MNAGAGCVSSQDDMPGVFAEPWDYSEAPNDSLDYEEQMRLLKPSIELVCSKRGDSVQYLIEDGRYLRALITDAKTNEKSGENFCIMMLLLSITLNAQHAQKIISLHHSFFQPHCISCRRYFPVAEFYFTPNDTTVQFRIGTLSLGSGGSGLLNSSLKNMERSELIRKKLRYTKIPVLRNRKRSFFFGESDLDTFGPGSAALGPPAEMTDGEIEGRLEVDPNRDSKIDLTQSLFPMR